MVKKNKKQPMSISPEKAAEMWVSLNIWEIPKELKGVIAECKDATEHRPSFHEVLGAMAVLELLAGSEEINKAWEKRISIAEKME